MSIGPLAPAERVDEPRPMVPPEAYAARSINVFQANGTTLVINVKLDPEGTYHVELPAGTYVVNIARSGIDRGVDLPQTITISGGQKKRLDISIDTGIR